MDPQLDRERGLRTALTARVAASLYVTPGTTSYSWPIFNRTRNLCKAWLFGCRASSPPTPIRVTAWTILPISSDWRSNSAIIFADSRFASAASPTPLISA